MAGARRIVVEFLGDDKTLSKTLKDVDDRSSKLGTTMAKVGKAAAYGLGAGLVLAGAAAVKFVEAAAQDQVAAEQLEGQLKRNADATDKQVASTEKWITAQGRALGVTDDELRPALGALVTATHDVGKAQELASLAMDVSAARGKSLQAVSEALMKAQNGNAGALEKLGVNTKNAAGETVSFTELTKRMADQFGGAASEKADTFQGKMDRLKLMLSETGEAIGYKLMPVAEKLMDWISATAIPAVEKFTHQWEKHKGQAGDVRDILEKVRDVVAKVTKVLWDNKEIVVILGGAYVAFKVGVLLAEGAMKAAKIATAAWTVAQWLLNVALDANPIGLVVLGVAALVGGFILAYKKSETFRNGVNKAWEILQKFIGFTPLGVLIREFDGLKNAVGYVIDKVKDLIDWISNIHMPKIDLPNLNPFGRRGGNSVGLDNPGAALVASIVKGIDKGKVKLQFALDKLKAFIVKHQANLADLLDKKSQVVDALKGFTSSIFSADLSVGEGEAPAGIQRLLDFGRNARAQAEALAANVKSLIAKGLSKDLIQQLVGSGASGQEQIALLAAGTAQDIMMANEDNAATVAALQEAGVAAGGALYDAAIKQEERDINLATMIKDQLKALLDLQDKNTVVELHLDGQTIYVSLKKLKRARGQSLDL